MDPYLEEPNLWSDVHLTLIIAMRGALNAQMPQGFVASADKYVWIHEPDADARTRVVRPDGFIVQHDENVPANPSPTITSAPAMIVIPAARREGNKYLKIRDARTRRLVTVIEMLSPANKEPGPDREAYLTKRIDYLTAGVNLVEIDLLRAGLRLPLGEAVPEHFDYYALVCRANEMPAAGFWPFTVRDSFPKIPIPLTPNESDVLLDLKPCLDWAFQQGRYEVDINYSVPAIPPLSPADAAWAKELTET
jgi:hypothetical protein